MKNENIFVADNFRLAMALATSGFSIRSVEKTIDSKDKARTICELDAYHNGVDALYLKECFEHHFDQNGVEHGIDLPARINEIIDIRGITQEEYILIVFDAAKAAISNNNVVISCIKGNKPLIARDLKDGRHVIFRQGTPKEQIESLIRDS